MDRDNIHLHHPPHRDLHKLSMGSGRQHEDRGFFQENREVPQEEENWGSLQWRKKPKWHLEERKNEVPWKSQKPLQEMEQVLGAATWWCTYGLMFLWSLFQKKKITTNVYMKKKITKIVKKHSHSYTLSAQNRIVIDRQALATGARDILVVKYSCK